CLVFSNCPCSLPHLHSFPTRRSSDLVDVALGLHQQPEAVSPAYQGQRRLGGPENHHALGRLGGAGERLPVRLRHLALAGRDDQRDRKSTRLNSSHLVISYAVFCLKKK